MNSGPPGAVSVVDPDALARARYMGYMRRTMPPRCSPVSILIVVLSLGMLFIGVTMTLIANWPGATTIGENPLRIAGPVLLAVGGTVFFLGVVLACVLNNRERSKWEQSITDLAAQRSVTVTAQPLVTSNYPYSDQPSSDGYRKSILRNSRGSGGEEGPGQYEDSGKAYPVDGLPEAPRHSGTADDNIPDPVRVRKSRGADRSGIGSSSGSANVSEIGAADLGSIGVYSPPVRGSRHNGAGSPPVDGYSNNGYVPGVDMQRGEEGEWMGGRQRRKERDLRQGQSQVGEQQQQYEQQHLRLHIRAQPGATVHITPSATPTRVTPPPSYQPSRQRGGYPSVSARQHDDSAETEI